MSEIEDVRIMCLQEQDLHELSLGNVAIYYL